MDQRRAPAPQTPPRRDPVGPGGWTARRVCEEAHALGALASNRQFQSYVSWGLIRSLEDGGWAPETVHLLVLISDARRQARPLHRRVLLLRRDYFTFPVPNQTVREAMIALASASIEHPRRKLRVIVRLWNEWSQLHGDPVRWPGAVPWRGRARPPLMPPTECWVAILQNPSLTDEVIGLHITFAYQFDREVSAGLPPWSEAMPVEERILLLVILSLSWRPGSSP